MNLERDLARMARSVEADYTAASGRLDPVAEHIENDRLLAVTIEKGKELIDTLEAERDADFARAERAESALAETRERGEELARTLQGVIDDVRSASNRTSSGRTWNTIDEMTAIVNDAQQAVKYYDAAGSGD